MNLSLKNNHKPLLCLILIFSLQTQNIIAQQIPKVDCGTIKRLTNFQSKFVRERNIDIWLPEGYSSQKKYAVLYMHDGQMLFDSTLTWNHKSWNIDRILCKAISSYQIKNCIVVGIWNTASRHQEYLPQKAFYSMTGVEQQRILAVGKESGKPLIGNGPISDNYLKFIVNDLKPYIDSHFSTLKNRDNTFIAGSSMGGLISLYAICEYPNIFGGAICMSSHWPGIFTTVNNPIPNAILHYLKSNIPSSINHKLYFDYGDKTLDTMYKPYQMQADTIMMNAGYHPNNWLTREFPGDDHSEDSWGKRFEIPILFMLKTNPIHQTKNK